MMSRARRSSLIALSTLVLGSCTTTGRIWQSPETPRADERGALTNHVVVISVDGLRPDAIERFGAAKGSILALWRLLRCNPFSKGGWDPVPLQFDLLGRHKIPQPDPLSRAQRSALEFDLLLANRTKWHGRKSAPH